MPEASPKDCSQPKTTRTAQVLALSLGQTLSMAASLVFGMIAARCLAKHDYATIRQTFLAYQFAEPLLILGLPNALYYFLPREQKVKRGVIVDAIALLTGTGCLFSLFMALGGHKLLAMRFNNPDLQRTLPWLVLYPLCVVPVAGLAAVLTSAGRAKTLDPKQANTPSLRGRRRRCAVSAYCPCSRRSAA